MSGAIHIEVLLAGAVLAAGPLPAAAGNTDEAFGAALERRDVAGAIELLDAGADPNTRLRYGKTPLMAAAKTGAAGLARRLIERGADVNARNDNGGTALMFAAIRVTRRRSHCSSTGARTSTRSGTSTGPR